jgi:hypothetical protein
MFLPQVFFTAGTGMPGIFTLTDPSRSRLVKNSVFQSAQNFAQVLLVD